MDVAIHPLDQDDLPEADRIFRLAFGTFLNLPDPMLFTGDADLVRTRWIAGPEGALGAYSEGQLVGSCFAANWGSFGLLGPLTVRPDLWDQGIAGRLLDPTLALFDRWGVRLAGLFTFPDSPKHLGLYQKFGFWPQHLTPVLSRTVEQIAVYGWSTFSTIPTGAREQCLALCRSITGSVFPGLDLRREILATDSQHLGDTVLVYDGVDLAGFAVCHVGAGSEAGSGVGYVKFGAVMAGESAPRNFGALLSACEAFAGAQGIERILAGVNTARHQAYRMMLDAGFRTQFIGVAMHRPNEPSWNRPDCFVVDDWR